MKDDNEAKVTRVGADVATQATTDDELLHELQDSRRAALNLMEDAVTAREQAESALEALRTSEERMRHMGALFFELIESAPFGVYLVDSKFRLAQVSAASQKVFENVRPLIGRDFAEVLRSIWQEPFASEAIERFRHTLATGEEYHSVETTERRGDIDDTESYDWMLKRISLPDGTFGVVCYFLDLTDRKRAEAALRRSEERLRLLMDSFTDIAITTTSLDGIVETWNPGAGEIFGYSAEEIIGRSADILFTPEDRAAHVPDMEMAIAREKGRAADERWHLRKDGSRFYASGVMVPLKEGSRLLGYAKIARDLTKDKQAEADLQAAHATLEARVEERTAALNDANISLRQEMIERQRAEEQRVDLLRRVVSAQEEERSRIARDMHDQLGQQLTALRLKIASLVADKSMGPRLAGEIASLQEATARLDSEISFLAWELRPAALDDLGFVTAIRAFIAEWSRHHGIAAEFHDGRLQDRRFDPAIETNLYRIVQEALNNVYKHAKATSVNVVIELRRSDIVVVIEDDGVGFYPDEKKSPTESGRGLGLIGMRERAAIVGGSIEIESGPDKGTTIFVRVPAVFGNSEASREASSG